MANRTHKVSNKEASMRAYQAINELREVARSLDEHDMNYTNTVEEEGMHRTVRGNFTKRLKVVVRKLQDLHMQINAHGWRNS